MATQEPVESGSCPSVTRGVYVVVVLENPEMRRGRLGGAGSFSENPESPGGRLENSRECNGWAVEWCSREVDALVQGAQALMERSGSDMFRVERRAKGQNGQKLCVLITDYIEMCF